MVSIGGFNSVLHVEDRVGGNPITMEEIMDFKVCIDTSEWIELPYSGSKYACNKKHGDNRIFSKLDWAFVNQNWLDNMQVSREKF